jgi:hypothetical protein
MNYDLAIMAEFIWREFDTGKINILDLLNTDELEQIKEGKAQGFVTTTLGSGEVVIDNRIQSYWYQRLTYYCYVNCDGLVATYGFPPNTSFGQIADHLIELEIMKRTNF